MSSPGPDEIQEELTWERSRRVVAAVAAALGGVLVLVPLLYADLATRDDRPVIGVLQALTPALSGEQDAEVNPRTAVAQFLVDHSTPLIISGVLSAIGALAVGVALLYLYRATRFRLPALPRYVRGLITFGAAFTALASLGLPIVRRISAQDYLDAGDFSREAINDALGSASVATFGILGLIGTLAVCLSTILVALNAMRAGLLTRFMGILGIIAGALYVLGSLIGQFPIVQAFWLVALAPLFLGRWPRGNPPAWESGKAEPWPSAAELREQRMREQGQTPPPRGGRGGGRAAQRPEPDTPSGNGVADLADDAAEPRPAPHPATSRKKRRRKR